MGLDIGKVMGGLSGAGGVDGGQALQDVLGGISSALGQTGSPDKGMENSSSEISDASRVIMSELGSCGRNVCTEA